MYVVILSSYCTGFEILPKFTIEQLQTLHCVNFIRQTTRATLQGSQLCPTRLSPMLYPSKVSIAVDRGSWAESRVILWRHVVTMTVCCRGWGLHPVLYMVPWAHPSLYNLSVLQGSRLWATDARTDQSRLRPSPSATIAPSHRMLNPGKIWHEYLTDLSTSPVRSNYFTSGNQKVIFWTLIITRSHGSVRVL